MEDMKPDCDKWILFRPQLVQPPAFLNYISTSKESFIGSYIDQLAKVSIGWLEQLSRHLRGFSQQNSARETVNPLKFKSSIHPQKTQLPGKWTIWRCHRNCLDTEGELTRRLCLPQGWYNREEPCDTVAHFGKFLLMVQISGSPEMQFFSTQERSYDING